KDAVTPNLDKLAEDGVKFEYTFTCQPVCGPARACIQSGQYATETGCFVNAKALPENERTIAKCLSEKGYEVGYLGKWHLASNGKNDLEIKPVPPAKRGGYKDFWLAADALEHTSHSEGGYMFDAGMNKIEFKGYRVDSETDFALDYLKNRKTDKPFFFMISYLEPHHQNDRKRYEGPEGSKERFKNFEVPGDLAGTEGDWRENYPDYLGCCASLDKNLGRIIEELKRQGIYDNTVIIFSTDHGSHFRTRNSEYKRTCHEGAIRIPLVIHGPGFKGGKTVKELVSLIDIPPSILAVAGVEKPEGMRGHAVQEIVNGVSKDWPEEVFIQISESQVGRAIRTKKWKYSVYAPHKNGYLDSNSDVYVEQYLYDLEKDPFEKKNLTKDPAYIDVRQTLSGILKKRMSEAGESVPEILPAQDYLNIKWQDCEKH
ncbi:MAG: arylsulfatase, partial [Candidatus Firestonebacteria bacterium RIFOXYA2_FULL_40_8]